MAGAAAPRPGRPGETALRKGGTGRTADKAGQPKNKVEHAAYNAFAAHHKRRIKQARSTVDNRPPVSALRGPLGSSATARFARAQRVSRDNNGGGNARRFSNAGSTTSSTLRMLGLEENKQDFDLHSINGSSPGAAVDTWNTGAGDGDESTATLVSKGITADGERYKESIEQFVQLMSPLNTPLELAVGGAGFAEVNGDYCASGESTFGPVYFQQTGSRDWRIALGASCSRSDMREVLFDAKAVETDGWWYLYHDHSRRICYSARDASGGQVPPRFGWLSSGIRCNDYAAPGPVITVFADRRGSPEHTAARYHRTADEMQHTTTRMAPTLLGEKDEMAEKDTIKTTCHLHTSLVASSDDTIVVPDSKYTSQTEVEPKLSSTQRREPDHDGVSVASINMDNGEHGDTGSSQAPDATVISAWGPTAASDQLTATKGSALHICTDAGSGRLNWDTATQAATSVTKALGHWRLHSTAVPQQTAIPTDTDYLDFG